MKLQYILTFFIAFSFIGLQAQVTTETDSVSASEGEDVFTFVEQQPQYPGGDDAFFKFLDKNMKYPTEAREKGIQGTVWLRFVIGKEGKISEVTVVRGIGGGCDEEAKRVVEHMPNWIPGTQSGKPVAVRYNFPIKFSMN